MTTSGCGACSCATARQVALPCDAILIQDLGLGEPGFLMNNEAYASQYLDHHVARHARMGQVLMGRQNLAQGGRHPWVAHGCLEGAVGFATDFLQLMGPAYRDAEQFAIPFGSRLPSLRLQHETACAALQSWAVNLTAGDSVSLTFFGIYRATIRALRATLTSRWSTRCARLTPSRCPRCDVRADTQLLLEARCAVATPLSESALRERYPGRRTASCGDGGLLSFFRDRRKPQPSRRPARQGATRAATAWSDTGQWRKDASRRSQRCA